MAFPTTPAFLVLQHELGEMLGSLSETEILSLGYLKVIVRWFEQSINWPMLEAALRFWQCRCHLFRFGLAELGPTFEEFSAILGYPLICPPVIVNYSRRSRDVLAEFLRSAYCSSEKNNTGLKHRHDVCHKDVLRTP
jgi:Plant mobile domain.